MPAADEEASAPAAAQAAPAEDAAPAKAAAPAAAVDEDEVAVDVMTDKDSNPRRSLVRTVSNLLGKALGTTEPTAGEKEAAEGAPAPEPAPAPAPPTAPDEAEPAATAKAEKI